MLSQKRLSVKLIFIAATGLVACQIAHHTKAQDQKLAKMEQAIFEAVNRERQKRRLKPLKRDDIAAIARSHSRNMSKRRFFSHDDPVAGDLAKRLQVAKIRYRICAENIAMFKGYATPVKQAVSYWMKSKEHRKNILLPEVTYTGVGIAEASDNALYFTQIFLRLP